MFVVLLLNVALTALGALTPIGLVNMFVVGITQMRDAIFVLIRVLFKPCVHQNPVEKEVSDELRNVLCVVPTYKEGSEEVMLTLNSLIAQEETKLVHKRIIMVCDGYFNYADIFSSMILIETFQYKTFKQKLNTVNVFVVTYNNYDLIVLLKSDNAGKKDSLILIDSIFVDYAFVHVRHCLLKFFNIVHFNYIFHTDADSFVTKNTIRRASLIMATNPKISGVTGIVLVPERYCFWSLFQGFQYYYGQLIRRLTESYWGKPTCMPGCTNMVNVSHDCIIEASTRYQKLPTKNYIFQVKNRLQGTDRRYTNCVLQYSKDVRLVTDGESHCFTIPPQSFNHFRSQRKRWTSNAITGYFFLLTGTNIPWYVRILAAIDLFRIHTCVTRLCSTFLLLTHIRDISVIQLVSICVVFGIPYLFFIFHVIRFKKYGLFLFAGSIVSKFASPFITVYIFLYCLVNFTDVSWGKTHGAASCIPTNIGTQSPQEVRTKGDDRETLV